MLEAYRKHVEERAAQGVVPQPLDEEQTVAPLDPSLSDSAYSVKGVSRILQ